MITHLQIVFLLGFLALFSALMFVSFHVLRLFSAHVEQKILHLKLGVASVICAPLFFLGARMIAWQPTVLTIKNGGLEELAGKRIFAIHSAAIPWEKWVIYFYCSGVALMTLRLLISFISTRRFISSSTPRELNGERVHLIESLRTPFSFGFFRPKVYFPAAGLSWSQREISLALAHEQIHCELGDTRWKVLSAIADVILFYVPFQFLLSRYLEDAFEVRCDDRTRERTRCLPKEYGNFLLRMSCLESPSMALITNINDSTLKRRIVAMKSRMISRKVLQWALGLSILSGSATTIAAVAGISGARTKYLIVSEIYVNGKLVADPRIITVEGETAQIIQENDKGQSLVRLAMVVTESPIPQLPQGIYLKMELEYQVDGKTMKSQPQIVVNEGEQGSVQVGDSSEESYELRITAERL